MLLNDQNNRVSNSALKNSNCCLKFGKCEAKEDVLITQNKRNCYNFIYEDINIHQILSLQTQ